MKRVGPLLFLTAGALVLVASLIYWRVTQSIANPGAAELPDQVAGLPLAEASYGPEAVAEVTQLHNKAFPLSSGAAAMYGGPGSMVMLWVTGSPTQLIAKQMVSQMESAIAEGESPFTPKGTRQLGGRDVFELSGMGQRHFYFRSSELVVWLAADETLAETALAEALSFYP